jgi:putative sigma-54 modulation protein
MNVSTNHKGEDMISSIDVTGIKYSVDEKTLKYVTEKVGKLDRFLPSHARRTMTADVKLKTVNKDHGNKYEAEVIVHLPEKTMTAKDTTINMMAAVDIVEAKLVAQLKKYKDARISRKLASST